jgi:hypothetical protein
VDGKGDDLAYRSFGTTALNFHYSNGAPLDPTWSFKRTRHGGYRLGISAHGHSISIYVLDKSYARLVGFPYGIDWVLDEFDSSFNELAIASLRFHLDYSHCDKEERRPVYEDLITRLGEPAPDIGETRRERTRLDEHCSDIDGLFEPMAGGYSRMRPTPPDIKAIFKRHRLVEEAYNARIDQARHDFVDIMRELWS